MYAGIYEAMRIDRFTFGSIRIDGVVYEHDVVIAGGQVRKRKKKASRPFCDAFGHTPLSVKEDIPWDCRRLVVGTGAEGALPVMDEFKAEAGRRDVELVANPTREAIRELQVEPESTNAILHVTC
ncbi:MAG: MTH938/NDUFAF3 family protein [Gaiellales bacterium]